MPCGHERLEWDRVKSCLLEVEGHSTGLDASGSALGLEKHNVQPGRQPIWVPVHLRPSCRIICCLLGSCRHSTGLGSTTPGSVCDACACGCAGLTDEELAQRLQHGYDSELDSYLVENPNDHHMRQMADQYRGGSTSRSQTPSASARPSMTGASMTVNLSFEACLGSRSWAGVFCDGSMLCNTCSRHDLLMCWRRSAHIYSTLANRS